MCFSHPEGQENISAGDVVQVQFYRHVAVTRFITILKNGGMKTIQGWWECCIMKAQLELPYSNDASIH